MKSYTNIEQSKKLAEILPIESADMCYGYIAPYEFSDRMYEGGYDNIPYPKDFMKKNPNFSEDEYGGEFPCWSLAALLEQIPSDLGSATLTIEKADSEPLKYGLNYHDRWGREDDIQTKYYDNLVDACYEMILKLHEQKIL